MLATRHNLKVHGTSLLPVSNERRDRAPFDELRAALEVILGAAANLRQYRERLTPEDHTATVRDIEQAAEQIFNGLELAVATTGGKPRAR